MTRKVKDFKPATKNSNLHTARGMGMIDTSMRTDGYGDPMLAAADGEMISGSARLETAALVFGTDVEPIVVHSNGDRPIIHVRDDIPNAYDKRAQRLALAANRSAEVDLAWDVSVIAGFDADVIGDLWTPAELSDLGQQWADGQKEVPGGDPGAQLNRAEELREQYQVTRGQIWQLGRHRVGCLDAYSEADRWALLDGATPQMLHIDPPYGINIVQPRKNATAAAIGGSKPFTGGTSGTERKSGAAERSAHAERGHVQHGAPSKNQIIQSNLYPVIEGDDRPFDPTLFLGLASIVIMWGGNYFAPALPVSSCWIAWDKREDITRNNFADCELAWTNLDKPARLFHHLWNGLHKGSQYGERRTHPTEKPVALFEEIGRMFCPTGIWLDLFAGTGAQLIAAERIPEVRCLACEIEPLYVATLLERFYQMTGVMPVLV